MYNQSFNGCFRQKRMPGTNGVEVPRCQCLCETRPSTEYAELLFGLFFPDIPVDAMLWTARAGFALLFLARDAISTATLFLFRQSIRDLSNGAQANVQAYKSPIATLRQYYN